MTVNFSLIYSKLNLQIFEQIRHGHFLVIVVFPKIQVLLGWCDCLVSIQTLKIN